MARVNAKWESCPEVGGEGGFYTTPKIQPLDLCQSPTGLSGNLPDPPAPRVSQRKRAIPEQANRTVRQLTGPSGPLGFWTSSDNPNCPTYHFGHRSFQKHSTGHSGNMPDTPVSLKLTETPIPEKLYRTLRQHAGLSGPLTAQAKTDSRKPLPDPPVRYRTLR
jgi:hypothetical protein